MVGPSANANRPSITILGRLLSNYRLILTLFIQIGRWSHLNEVLRPCRIWLMGRVGVSLGHLWLRFLKHCFTSSITIRKGDDIYAHFMKWLSQHPSINNSRSLLVETRYESIWDSIENLGDYSKGNTEDFINSSHQDTRTSLIFTPNFGFYFFLHDGRRFFMQRAQSVLPVSVSSALKTEDITVTCIGRSTLPLRKLLSDARSVDHQKKAKTTTIYRPGPENARRFGHHYWTECVERPIRPMETVVLDKQIKQEILEDIEEYGRPESLLWYARQGIPYRRGHLYEGPPGTGKTTMVLALAGNFSLDIYMISLADPAMSDDDLAVLFEALPRESMVLLEDIDTITFAYQRTGDTQEKSRHLSLNGLLNAIDGVASQEGRFLIMTTNHPELLDEALIRPGRIDLIVRFGLANKDQIRELFRRLYSNDTLKKPLNKHGVPIISEKRTLFTAPKRTSNSLTLTEEELVDAAAKFAEKIPSDTFSPATIQGFLLKRKNNPHLALEEVDNWIKSEMQSRFDNSENAKQAEKVEIVHEEV